MAILLRPYFQTILGQLFHADAFEWLASIPQGSVDLIIADPPYNIKKAEWDSFESQAEYVDWSLRWIRLAAEALKPEGTLYVCGFSEILADVKWAASRYFRGCKWLVWYYRNKANLGNDWGRSHESIIHFRKSRHFTFNVNAVRIPYNAHTVRYPAHPQAKSSQYGQDGQKPYLWRPNPLGAKPRDVLEMPTLCNETSEKTLHPTQKPEELIKKLVLASSNEGQMVVDPFGGAGTTFVVCQKYNRRWLGCEVRKEYCDVIVDRLTNPRAYEGDRSLMDEGALHVRRQKLRYATARP